MKLKKNKGPGRPTVIDESVILKLETAFALGCKVKEALSFAGLSKDSYSRFIRRQPEYRERFEQLRDKPVLMARRQVVDAIGDGDTNTARWYLERKRADEFGPKANVNVDIKHHQLTEAEVTRELMKFLAPGKTHERVSGNPDSITPEIEYDGSESAII